MLELCHSVTAARVVVVIVLLSGCSGPSATMRPAVKVEGRSANAHELINAVAWMQHAAEYEAVTVQAYNTASRLLPIALEDTSWTALPDQKDSGRLQPAVIVDVDETVLDNSPFQARLVANDTVFVRPLWNAWVEERAAAPVPGALDFLTRAAAAGVTVFYVTNRSHELDDATTENLREAGFPVSGDRDVVLTRGERPEWTGDKSLRREFVAEDYRVIMLVGDDLNDFVAADDGSAEERAEMVRQHGSYWGERWVILPNPSYGSWERVITRSAGAYTRFDQVQAKRKALRTR